MPVSTNSVADHSRRRTALAAKLDLAEVDALLVSDLVNVRYLTGFTGSNAGLLVWGGARTDRLAPDRIATDGRYRDQVARQAPGLTTIIERDTSAALVGLAAQSTHRGALRIGFEAHALTVAELADLQALPGTGAVTLVPLRGIVEELREVKDDDEVALVTAACGIADAALAALIERGAIAPGRTERAVARELEWEMYALGADAIAFETIVAAGANSAIPHHRPTDAVLAAGDLVKIDFGAVASGYHSDMTRTMVLGAPAPWQREIYDLVEQAQAAGRAALAAGAKLVDIDGAARSVIDDAGYGEYYVHGLGHGVGLQIHEAPGIGATATGTLVDGAIVTVEPGIYLPGRGGVRIEDTLVVLGTGSRSLTHTPRALRSL